MREVTFEIVERYGVITEHGNGWNKELNKVSWNGHKAKWDIRDWSPDHEQMGRGITLTDDEFARVLELGKEDVKDL